MTIAERLAAFASELQGPSIPASAIEAAKDHILDGIGIALASSGKDFARKTVSALETFGGGDSPVIGFSLQLPSRDAALANGVLIHGLDFDDTHLAGVVHPTAGVFPCVLAVGAQAGSTGLDLLTAYVLGVECAARLGTVAKGELNQIGFHPTGVINTFAAALAAGKLLRLDPDQMTMAQAIALSMAAGTREYSSDGSWTKRLHPGFAAASGMTAAALARSGFRGPPTAYEGPFGLYATHLGRDAVMDLAAATQHLGSVWEVERVAIKPVPACQLSIASIEAAVELSRAHDLDAADIAAVHVEIPPHAVAIVCEPAERRRQPSSSYAAQFSIQFGVACALMLRRFGLAELERFDDPQIRQLAARVTYSVDGSVQAIRDFSGKVEVTLNDGKRLARRKDTPSGAPTNPVDRARVVEKFLANAEGALAPRQADALVSEVVGLERAGQLSDLCRLVRRPG